MNVGSDSDACDIGQHCQPTCFASDGTSNRFPAPNGIATCFAIGSEQRGNRSPQVKATSAQTVFKVRVAWQTLRSFTYLWADVASG
ncbi:hypothetical protein PAXRUDRAFT_496938 [Paxillus rubicundulus Ve08.2h10]|uniref:Uncharacterized protein n=1 Tax=Paxillus rubicundulus Ve08.2h10 TaxID=930991 RepID=A0A0D0E9M0_9AGAM|nr:hypothetical protein PAXRUDRAFT_496938 [Paxillus rubicundulus Ve08.2h10]